MGEIFAAAIQDHGLGPVIGTTTAGSVAAAQVYSLQDGAGIQITVMEITSAHGRALNVVGVAPDRVVEQNVLALQDGHDVQLEAAVQAIRPNPVHALGSGFRHLPLAS
jgi:carboxyl-terminal processing protease